MLYIYAKKFFNRLANAIDWRIRRYWSHKANKLREKQLQTALNSSKSIFVFGSPRHSNLGDQAQSYCIRKWCKENYPDYVVILIDVFWAFDNNSELLTLIRKKIQPGAKIFLHSGYHMTDLYESENKLIESIVEMFPDFPIVLYPQTINYLKKDNLFHMRDVLKTHPDVCILCRDRVSYQIAIENFPFCKLILFPDIVTSLIGHYKRKPRKRGFLLCVRNDKESILSRSSLEFVIQQLKKIDSVSLTDTTIDMQPEYLELHRGAVLRKVLSTFAKVQVVITDRYHGTIFSLIAGTPVIVLDSSDHKLRSGVDWFKNTPLENFIHYAGDLEQALEIARHIHGAPLFLEPSPYFLTEYYKNLKSIIETK